MMISLAKRMSRFELADQKWRSLAKAICVGSRDLKG